MRKRRNDLYVKRASAHLCAQVPPRGPEVARLSLGQPRAREFCLLLLLLLPFTWRPKVDGRAACARSGCRQKQPAGGESFPFPLCASGVVFFMSRDTLAFFALARACHSNSPDRSISIGYYCCCCLSCNSCQRHLCHASACVRACNSCA